MRVPGRLLIMLFAAGLVGAIAMPAWAYWSDDVEVTGATVTAYRVAAPSNVACTLTNKELLYDYWHGMRITATVPAAPAGGPAYSYSVQMVRVSAPGTVLWSHPLTPSGTTVTYNFVNADITSDQPVQDQTSVDYFVRIVVSLVSAPSWSASGQVNIDANNSPGILGIIGAGVYYGSPRGANSPGGMAGACARG